jgi:tetratricopeptide (TPR) repeat protein
MIAEPSRNSSSARALLLTRAKGREGPSPADLDHSKSLTLELWSSRISAPDSSDDIETSLALKRLIRQVHRMTFNDKSLTSPSASSAEPAPVTAPSAPPTVLAEGAPPAQAEAVANPTPETDSTLSAQVRKTLADLQRNPSRVRDPLETAELLFLSGRPGDAAAFYEEALRRTSPDNTASRSDRAWILFQLGNCLRETDAAKAQDTYAKLISEYPDSPWTEMARVGGRLLTWYQNTRPDQLVAPAR